jgi:tetratricopeptide (TPR) repeat protein
LEKKAELVATEAHKCQFRKDGVTPAINHPRNVVKYLKQIQEINDLPCYNLGLAYNRTGQYDKAITELEKCLEVYRKWGKKFLKNS